jgi:ribosomal protein S18 acetylase RimI-like enzyme
MDYQLRVMTAADYDRVYKLWQSCQGIGLHQDTDDSREAIAAYLARNPGLSFVAEDGKKIIGAILAGHDGRRGSVNHLAVAESQRSQGLGKQLMDACIDELGKQGIRKCNMFVYQDNAAALGFYEKRGCLKRDDLVIIQEEIGVTKEK